MPRYFILLYGALFIAPSLFALYPVQKQIDQKMRSIRIFSADLTYTVQKQSEYQSSTTIRLGTYRYRAKPFTIFALYEKPFRQKVFINDTHIFTYSPEIQSLKDICLAIRYHRLPYDQRYHLNIGLSIFGKPTGAFFFRKEKPGQYYAVPREKTAHYDHLLLSIDEEHSYIKTLDVVGPQNKKISNTVYLKSRQIDQKILPTRVIMRSYSMISGKKAAFQTVSEYHNIHINFPEKRHFFSMNLPAHVRIVHK